MINLAGIEAGGTINLSPVLNVLLWVAAIGVILFVVFWVGFFLLIALHSVFDFASGGDNELGAGIVFYGVIAIVIALIVLAFTHDIVAFE